ncbi:hypothetical protein PSI23_20525 [Xenorhabdus sp. XENO-10]|uniref:Uncharacterized protein n=1 Tax=Xenorhabdus yunnanensis TaxID=3025878 RepID=A0ABT5LP63_9GAMM|nr:hypothetical protein [Xenorhabdus yunnanensis]MDC9591599.1 hypothetical protein [Xenorhabdus yunnanensis]
MSLSTKEEINHGLAKRIDRRPNRATTVKQQESQLAPVISGKDATGTQGMSATTARVWLIDCRSFNEWPMVS